jgi:hypothetical protein
LHTLDGPIGGLIEGWGIRQVRTINVGQVENVFHDLGIPVSLRLDAVYDVEVGRILSPYQQGKDEKGE